MRIVSLPYSCFKVSEFLCFAVSEFHRTYGAVSKFQVSPLRSLEFQSFSASLFQSFIAPAVLFHALRANYLSHLWFTITTRSHHLSLITYHLSLLVPISYPWHMLSNAGRRLSGIGSTGGETILRGSIGVPPFHTRKSR